MKTTTQVRSFEQAEESVCKLIAVMTQRFPAGFPGLDEIGYTPATDEERVAIVLACACGASRLNGQILDVFEGRLQAMDAYGLIDARALANQPIMPESMRNDGAL